MIDYKPRDWVTGEFGVDPEAKARPTVSKREQALADTSLAQHQWVLRTNARLARARKSRLWLAEQAQLGYQLLGYIFRGERAMQPWVQRLVDLVLDDLDGGGALLSDAFPSQLNTFRKIGITWDRTIFKHHPWPQVLPDSKYWLPEAVPALVSDLAGFLGYKCPPVRIRELLKIKARQADRHVPREAQYAPDVAETAALNLEDAYASGLSRAQTGADLTSDVLSFLVNRMVIGQDTLTAGRLRVKDPTPQSILDPHDVCNPHPTRAKALPALRTHLTELEGTLKHPEERALVHLAASLRAGFYQSGNFATAWVVASAMLITGGYQPLITTNTNPKHDWDTTLKALYRTGDATPLMRLLLP